jgi:hypothetical protein
MHSSVLDDGIYWSRSPFAKNRRYKSFITQVQYVQLATRTYLLTRDESLLHQAEEV